MQLFRESVYAAELRAHGPSPDGQERCGHDREGKPVFPPNRPLFQINERSGGSPESGFDARMEQYLNIDLDSQAAWRRRQSVPPSLPCEPVASRETALPRLRQTPCNAVDCQTRSMHLVLSRPLNFVVYGADSISERTQLEASAVALRDRDYDYN